MNKKTNDTHASGIYQAVCLAYFAQGVCENPTLWFSEQYLEGSKTKAFAGEASDENIGESRK